MPRTVVDTGRTCVNELFNGLINDAHSPDAKAMLRGMEEIAVLLLEILSDQRRVESAIRDLKRD